MKVSRISLALAFISTFVGGTNATAADQTYKHVIVDTYAEGVNNFSTVYALSDATVQKIMNNEETNHNQEQKQCYKSLHDDPCGPTTGLNFRVFLPVCQSATQQLCIDALTINGVKGNFLQDTGGTQFAPEPARGFPGGFSPSLFKVPGANNKAGTDTYAVKVLLDGFIKSTSTQPFIFDVTAVVEPYSERQLAKVTQPDGKSVFAMNEGECTSWFTEGDGRCGMREAFADGQRISLSLHVPNTVTGWLHGRLKDSSIEVAPISATDNKLTVEATPVVVPEINVTLTEAQENSLPNPSYFKVGNILWNSVSAGNKAALDWIKQLSGVMKNTITGEHVAWSFSTISANHGTNPCLADKTRMIGLVSTNAAVYAPGNPDFVDGFLSYQVGGMHYKTDGVTPVTGTYDLLIRSDVARCLYGFTDAPVSATASVTSENGSSNVATSILNEKNGWLHLGAYGFTYSTPTISVKLTGTPIPEEVPVKAPTISVSKSIICVKGKVKKTVSGSSPKCPTGFKKS